MKIHHLNCATMRPPFRRLVNGSGSLWQAGRMVCHCLLVETGSAGLVLVDTGLGTPAVADPARVIGQPILAITRPALDGTETALHQVKALGYRPDDVRHIVLTHLDFDHCLGISDFPQAKIHVSETELAAAREPRTTNERARYKQVPWSANPDWVPLSPGGESWYGFASVRELPGLPAEIVALPLAGHTRGHLAVAVDTGADAGPRWLLHAGDAFFHHGQLDRTTPWCPPGLRLFESIVDIDRRVRRANTERLRDLAGTGAVEIFAAHDPDTFDRLRAARHASRPAA